MRRAAHAAILALLCAGSWALYSHEMSRVARAARRVPVWVFFQPDSTWSDAAPALSEESLRRRERHAIPVLASDRPLPPALIARVRATGAHIREQSRWLRAVSVDADALALARLAALPVVTSMQRLGRFEPAGGVGRPLALAAKLMTGATRVQAEDSAFFGLNYVALRALNVPAARNFSFRGTNVHIAILDSGFETRHESLASRSVIAARDFINGDAIVYDQPSDPNGQAAHGTRVWSILGGFSRNTIVGPASDAQFILAKVDAEPGDTRGDEDRWVAGMEWADSLGADLIVSALAFRNDYTDGPSLAYNVLNGDSTKVTRAADEAARRGILVVTAMGDDGPAAGSLSAPADADSVIAVGGVDANGQVLAISSRGPTFDGRIKPELVARGTGLIGAALSPLNGYDGGLSGTSYSTALLGGAAGIFLEAWPNLTADAVRNALRLSANRANSPDNAVGGGMPDLAAAILFPAGLQTGAVANVDLNGALTTIGPTFNWQASLGPHAFMRPVQYRVQLATDPNFNNVIARTDTITENFSLAVRRPIRPAPRLYWRVVASVRFGVQVVTRTVDSLSVPNWVRLLAPDPTQTTTVNTVRPDLTWVPLAAPAPIGPLLYDVEIISNQTGQLVQPPVRNLATATLHVPEPLVPNTAYRWRVIARTQTGEADTVESARPFLVTSDTLPPSTQLYQNFPNPFPRFDLDRTATQVWFDLAQEATVQLTVLDLRGRLIRRLIPAAASCGAVTLRPGLYGRAGPLAPPDPCVQTSWDGTDASGRQVPGGIYLLQLRAGNRVMYRHMVFQPGGGAPQPDGQRPGG